MFDVHPIPLIEEVLESIHSSADVVTTLDLASCYWKISMVTQSCDKTAFTILFGLLEFEFMPFGLHSALATFQS